MYKTMKKLTAAVLFSICILFLTGCGPATSASVFIPLRSAIDLSKNGDIDTVIVDTSNSIMTLTSARALTITDDDGVPVNLREGEHIGVNIDSLNMADLQTLGFVFPEETSIAASNSSLSSILLFVIPIALIIGAIYFLSRAGRGAQNQAMGFARSRARLASPDRPKVTFADVAGAEEAKEDLQEVVEFLKNRWKFQAMGATVPKGVLLVGPPGTGKTLLAKAVAGEAGVPFFSVSGSEFVEMFVGVGAARVRDMFAQAKHSAPCILFIDEIDAVGRVRSGAMPGSHEEREQTLNQILVEMDGFDSNIGIVVLAATNRADVLDPALLRPGRFDRRVILDRPDTAGRAAILQVHAKGKKLDPNVDLASVAKDSHGFSGADLANLMNEAAILAVRRKKQSIGMSELEESIDRVIAGPERKSLRISPRDKETTAYHEAGHAIVAYNLPNVDPVRKISIVARGSMGGFTRLLEEDRYFMTASQFKDSLAVLMAGHASEEMMFGEVSTGPHSDIKQATEIARKMITSYGMSRKLGLRTYGRETSAGYLGLGAVEEKDYSEDIAREIDHEVNEILEDAHQISRRVLHENQPRLIHLAKILLLKENLEGEELQRAFTEPLDDTDTKPVFSKERQENAAARAKAAASNLTPFKPQQNPVIEPGS